MKREDLIKKLSDGIAMEEIFLMSEANRALLLVEDSSNSAGVVIDAIRCCKLAFERGNEGVLYSPSVYFMKHPPKQYNDDEAYQQTEDFIEGKREH